MWPEGWGPGWFLGLETQCNWQLLEVSAAWPSTEGQKRWVNGVQRGKWVLHMINLGLITASYMVLGALLGLITEYRQSWE